jgi:hypothetical protein
VSAPRPLPEGRSARRAGEIAERSAKKAVAHAFTAARMADHYHSASEHGIIGRRIETIGAGRFHRPRRGIGARSACKDCVLEGVRGDVREEGDGRMAAMKPRTGDGPLEVTKEGRGIVMRVPLEGGGRLVVELTADEAARLGDALKSVVG